MPLIPPEIGYSAALLTHVAVAALVAVAFGVYLALLLGSIRKSAYGEGKLLDLPPLGISLRYPAWWTLEEGGDEPRSESAAGGTSVEAVEEARPVRLRTGHHRGLLT